MAVEKVWTIGALMNWTETFLAGKGSESPRLDAQVLLAHALGCQRPQLYTRFEEVVDDGPRAAFRELVKRRAEGCPVAYLVGRKEFFLLPFAVSPAVLIPRPATETLVAEAIERLKTRTAPTLLDVGTGSGCIAVSVLKRNASVTAVAVDLSVDALEQARQNADTHGVANRIRFVESDLFAAVNDEPFDLIASNPPYIRTGDLPTLDADVRDHEPRTALDGGADGFAVIDRLLAEAPAHLKPGGTLLIEIGADQGDDMQRRVEAVGLRFVRVLKDGDGLPRVAIATKENA